VEIASKKVYQVLKSKGIDQIHQANSVITSKKVKKSGTLVKMQLPPAATERMRGEKVFPSR